MGELGVSLKMNGRCVKPHKQTNQIMPAFKTRNLFINVICRDDYLNHIQTSALLLVRRSNNQHCPTLKTKLNSVALVRERTIPTERPPPVGEVSANFCGSRGVTWSAQRFPTAVLISVF